MKHTFSAFSCKIMRVEHAFSCKIVQIQLAFSCEPCYNCIKRAEEIK